ncbi:MAG: amidohydrolase family protein [Candidatus Sphingomonas colombiensis]|nr:amidohydrolase family protein [Sphingomonas sp.]WEK44003.1 MAG: amidohydrolase family protein [Sphingomonas sp.]
MKAKWIALAAAAALLGASGTAMAQADSVLAPKAEKAADRWTIIHAGTLMADAGKPLARDASIIVKNGVIDAVRPGFVGAEAIGGGVAPGSVAIVELRDKFVMAGLIDAHVHIGFGNWSAAFQNAREKVFGGATTVRDAGSMPEVIFPLRDAINKGLVVGPRILASGAPLTTTGGHGDFRNGNFQASLAPPAFSGGVCDGDGECAKVTRRQIQLGADQIKIIDTAGVVDDSYTGLDQQFTDAELHAIVDASHLMKRKVMAHAIGADGIKAAVRAGVDSVEHGNYLDDEGAKLMKERGTYLVPTLEAPTDVLRRVQNPKAGDRPISENTRRKVLGMPEAQPGGIGRQVKVALRNGVKIAVGTDFGGTPGDEMVLLVRQGGMSSLAALRAVTLTNAELLGISSTAGTIEPGKSADIVAFDGNPIDEIEASTRVVYVMSQGHQFKGPGYQLP